MRTRPITDRDFAAILALNEQAVHYLSPLSRSRLEHLCRQSPLHLAIEDGGAVMGFIITLAQGADYDSVNYQWFAQRYEQFLYVDRIVVANDAQARGAGSAMYREVLEFARDEGFPVVACEFDIDPPNQQSAGFHRKFGFREVAQQRVANGSKSVSLQVASSPYRAALPHHSCPICGGPNACAAAAAGSTAVKCWCIDEQFDAELLARIPDELKRVACICRNCAREASGQAAAINATGHDK